MLIIKDHSPKTFDDAVDLLYRNLDDAERATIKTMKDGVLFHHGFGQAIRNGWGLWNGSDLKDHFINTYGVGHADDMSAMILDAVVYKVNGEPFDVIAEAQRHKNFWTAQGVDPITQEEIF